MRGDTECGDSYDTNAFIGPTSGSYGSYADCTRKLILRLDPKRNDNASLRTERNRTAYEHSELAGVNAALSIAAIENDELAGLRPLAAAANPDAFDDPIEGETRGSLVPLPWVRRTVHVDGRFGGRPERRLSTPSARKLTLTRSERSFVADSLLRSANAHHANSSRFR